MSLICLIFLAYHYLLEVLNWHALAKDKSSWMKKEMSYSVKILTDRQLEVLQLIANHLTNTEIALHLGLSHKTIELHVSSAMRRLDAKNRHHAVELARKAGLL